MNKYLINISLLLLFVFAVKLLLNVATRTSEGSDTIQETVSVSPSTTTDRYPVSTRVSISEVNGLSALAKTTLVTVYR